MGETRRAVGTPLHGIDDPGVLCQQCGHAHRVTVQGVDYIVACPICARTLYACAADGDSYFRLIETDEYDLYVTAADGLTRAYVQPFDSPSFPRCLPERVRGLDTGRRVRGGWLGRLVWSGVSRFAGHQRGQLAGERGNE